MDRITRLVLGTMLLVAGCSKGYDPEPPASVSPPQPTLTLERLHALYREEPVVLLESLVVSGRVTTSDRAGNFYRTLCIEDKGFGLEILVGGDQLHSRYPIGSQLVVDLQGLALDRSRGVLQAGYPAADYHYTSLTYLTAQAVIDRHLYRTSEPLIELEACPLRFEELTPEQCGSLVCVEGLTHQPLLDEEGNEVIEDDGYYRFCDAEGGVLHLYISSYARFKGEELPTGEVALRGILQQLATGDHAGYVIKPRDEKDILPN